MRQHVCRVCAAVALCVLVFGTGCTELYLFFGPGAIFGPGSSSVGSSTTTTTQPNVIAAPIFASSQIDPALEATAGAKVVVWAQLNDDNGDGVIDANDEVDLVSGHDENQPIQIHLNSGNGASFTTQNIAGGGPIARMIDLAVEDLNMDGRPDIAVLVNDTGFVPVTGADLRGCVVLLFNPADPSNALAWTEVRIDETFVLPNDETGMTDFVVVDIDLDVEADGVTRKGPDIVLGSNEVGDVEKHIRLYTNPGVNVGTGLHQATSGAAWTGSIIETDAVEFQSLEAADIDGDGDMDIVATFPTAKTFNTRWMVNPRFPGGVGAPAAASWSRLIVGHQQDGADVVGVGDVDGDGDSDVALADADSGLVQWFENPDDPGTGLSIVAQQSFPWRVFNLGQLKEGFTINQMQLVDLNLDGSVDCFVTASGNIVGMQRGSDVYNYWDAYSIVATNPVATIGRCAFADLNEDGLLDIIAPLDREGLTQDQLMVFTRLTP